MTETTTKTLKSFHCDACDYTTLRKDHYNKHCLSAKHRRLTPSLTAEVGLTGIGGDHHIPPLSKKNEKIYTCKCGRSYKHRQSLFKHKQKCTFVEEDSDSDKDKEIEELKKQLREKDRALAASEAQRTKADDTIATLSTKVGTTVNVFLNEHCKNAKPIMDFIKDIQFNFSSINTERPASAITSIGDNIVKRLTDMEKTERPIHCSDVKRLKFYVKDASGWAIDQDNVKLKKAVGWANQRAQSQWHRLAKKQDIIKGPNDCHYLEMNNAMGEWSEDVQKAKKKVIRMIAPKVKIKEANGSFSFAK